MRYLQSQIDDESYRLLKIEAVEKGITIRKLIAEIVLAYVKKDNEVDN